MTKSLKSTSKTKHRLPDAIAVLKADHRQVEQWFRAYEKAQSNIRKRRLASQICEALTIHMKVEEGIFYPTFIAVTRDKDLHHEAVVEHGGAKKLIRELAASSPTDDYFDAKMKVLSEQIKHHVKEEEQRGGMFAEARRSNMDLRDLGARIKSRKDELANQL
jgi:Hemerythrin HHE cation binding domain